MEALRAGSILGTGDFFMMMVERRAQAQASAKRERRRAGLSTANVGAVTICILYLKVMIL